MNILKIPALFIVACLFYYPALSTAKNQLAGHYSPYLAMHGEDPVNWMEWGEDALNKAKQEGKLIFISSGYFACHWCHVMHRESYSMTDVAAVLNANYIAIKIDREINPVLDKRLINFVQATNGTAGWPLNVILTPEGYPIVGATYIPKNDFMVALQRIKSQWKKDSKQIQKDAISINEQLMVMSKSSDSKGSKRRVADNVAALIQQIQQSANIMQGGFSKSQQFPSTPQLLALLRLKSRPKVVDEFIQLTLDNMQSRGLHDEVAGGFYRYTMDPDWRRPHYEKMLYTNALLPVLYLQASELYSNKEYQQTAIETMHFLLDEMQGPDGAFIASLSAVDNHGIEGGYYLWTDKELQKILSKDELKLAQLAWGIVQNSPDSEGVLPMLQHTLNELSQEMKQDRDSVQDALQKLKIRLKTYRNKHRVIPKDTKQLASWNGLVLAAFARLSVIDKKFKPAGKKLSEFLISLWDGKQLNRAMGSVKRGTLNDYAAVAWGLIQWGQITNDARVVKTANDLIEAAWIKFYTDKGWRESEHELLPDPIYRQHIEDSPIPASEALLIEASQLSGNPEFTDYIKQVLAQSTEDIESVPYSYAYLIAVSADD